MKVVEFFGMPRGGKTTALEVMESYFKEQGARVRTVYEGARVCPLDKSDRFNYNAWSFHNTVNRILEARLDHYDFILVDRGVIDHMCFLKTIAPLEYPPTLAYYNKFLDLQDLEISFLVNPEEAIRRESKHKPSVGRVFKKKFLEELHENYLATQQYFLSQGRTILSIDGNQDFRENLQQVFDISKKLLKGGE